MPRQKGQPLSVRLTDATQRLVDAEARRTRRSRGAVVGELTEEAAKMRLFPGIAFRGPEPRRAWAIATGLDVWEIVSMYRDYGGDVKALLAAHGLLDEPLLNLALAYAGRFHDEIEDAIADNQRPLEDWLQELPTAGVVRVPRDS